MYVLGKCPGAKVPGQYSSTNSYNCNKMTPIINPLNTKLNPICHLLALLGAHPIIHVSKIRVKLSLFMDVMQHRLVLIY
jgi:hypothetical protein